jgi:Tfp pilus assembly protein PilX
VALWLIIVLAVLVALIVVGVLVNVVRERRTRAAFEVRVSAVDRALAAAAAADRGWERTGLEAAARAAWEARHPGEPLHELELVEVIDPPGTADDYAVFRCRSETGSGRLTLGRREGGWVEHELRDEGA